VLYLISTTNKITNVNPLGKKISSFRFIRILGITSTQLQDVQRFYGPDEKLGQGAGMVTRWV
jgi:hypothetical protein